MQLGQGAKPGGASPRQALSLVQLPETNLERHFRWENTTLVGRTFSGEVTVQVLNINDPARVMLRGNLFFEGRFPHDE
jgi:hypothetical protein